MHRLDRRHKVNRDIESKIGSTIYQRLNAIPMSAGDREAAVNAMLDAELIVDAFEWAKSKLERLAHTVFLKPSTKH